MSTIVVVECRDSMDLQIELNELTKKHKGFNVDHYQVCAVPGRDIVIHSAIASWDTEDPIHQFDG